jgi:hypothetical protein
VGDLDADAGEDLLAGPQPLELDLEDGRPLALGRDPDPLRAELGIALLPVVGADDHAGFSVAGVVPAAAGDRAERRDRAKRDHD